ncbi:MAG TPA: HesA/MoeB/ThiF family protein [Spirochaetota bacterium]|nr:HesA/MoeB/ThiF family protein [Spirochaetota bacterium]HPF04460.1 HesA/MoeB/ThiF family protein [Spirochaetota bacterium]HPJ40768.1 HesA/MoeB/ThiF family protein [Spirochaetota bacterium]HPR36037.1 HesA/MoeB/ThiF family protein [Spirochaetota bacterium]HRX45951.1 HesA/MoeB/ThiF family protein [Spirochaetota bacterium]
MFTEDEIKRYQRHFDINGWGEDTQLQLKKSSVFVAGAGGLGSVVLYYLAAAGVGKISFCDSDTVDISNLNRQILYGIDDIGKDKVSAASAKLSALNKNIELIPFKGVIDEDYFKQISGCDLIIDCVDNFQTRHILNRISLDKKIPMLHAGVTEYYCQLTLLKPGETPCLGCFIPEGVPLSGKGIIGAMAGIAGSIEAMEAIKFLAGVGESLAGRLLFIDMKNLSFNTMNIKKNPACKICSGTGV